MVSVLPKAVSELEFVGVNIGLQLKTEDSFLVFHNEEWKNLTQKLASQLAARFPHVLWTMIRVTFGMIVDVETTSKLFVPSLHNRLVGHTNSGNDLPADVRASRFGPFRNADVTFSVEQSSGVSDFHSSLVVDEKMANSVDTQTGQYRAKQAERPGVCREHVPSPKGKICSELRRNTQTLAEMFRGFHIGARYNLHEKLTDCNTDYIFWRPHRDRNFVPIGGERQSVNQDAVVKLFGVAGNLTSSGPQFCGVLIA